jgi:hypothetical protein
MPNWVFNYLTVEGNPDTVEQLRVQVGKPMTVPIQSNGDLAYTVEDKHYEEPVFSFWNIHPPTDLEAYPKQPDFSSEKPWSDNSWYNFNNREWGTKWDVAGQADLVHDEPNGENHVLVYQFDTAWAPPVDVIQKLSAQYPTLLINLEYQEEQGWGGEIEFLNGEAISESEYDNKCYDCKAEYLDSEIEDECEDCYGVCPRCGYSENLCDEHDKIWAEAHKQGAVAGVATS